MIRTLLNLLRDATPWGRRTAMKQTRVCVCSVQHRIIGVGEEGVDEVSKRKAEDMFPGSDRW